MTSLSGEKAIVIWVLPSEILFCFLDRVGNLLPASTIVSSFLYSSSSWLFQPYGYTVLSFGIDFFTFLPFRCNRSIQSVSGCSTISPHLFQHFELNVSHFYKCLCRSDLLTYDKQLKPVLSQLNLLFRFWTVSQTNCKEHLL